MSPRSPATLRPRYMEKNSLSLNGHQPSLVNFRESLFKGKSCPLCPSQQCWTMLTLIEFLQLVETKYYYGEKLALLGG